MELLQLKYFCDAAENENFSHTAKKYDVPPSNISRAIRQLERELGEKLFERTSNKAVLNDNGRLFYDAAKLALTALDTAKREIMSSTVEPSGTIKLLIETNRRIVTQAIEKCRTRHPKISFIIQHGTEADDPDVIVSDMMPKRYTGEGELLISERILLASAKRFGESESVSLTSLINERFVTMNPGSRLYATTMKLCADAGFEPNVAIQTDDPFYVRKYVEMGLGVALIPEISWFGSFSENVRLYSIGGYERKIMLFSRPEKSKSTAEKLFCEILRECFKEAKAETK